MSGPIHKDADDGSLRLFGGTSPDKGAELNIFGVAHPHMPGCNQLVARAADGTTRALNLCPDGRMTWDDKEVVRLENTANRTPVIKLANGQMILWGVGTVAPNSYTHVVFYEPFAYGMAAIASFGGYAQASSLAVNGTTTTGFSVVAGNISTTTEFYWFAIGWWK